jgi:plasmid replication initiation protein
MKNKNLIYKDNNIIDTGYRLSIHEQRLILLAISQINALEKLTDERIFTISASDYSSWFGSNKEECFRIMKEAMDNLSNNWITVLNTEGKNKKIRWISMKSEIMTNQSVEMRFTKDIAPYLSQLEGNFTRYKLLHVSEMKSVFSIRLYEMLMQWKSTRTLTLTVDKLRSNLQLTTKGYTAFGNIKQKIIDPAILEINRTSDIDASYELIKKANKVVEIKFSFEFKDALKAATEHREDIRERIKNMKNYLNL